MSPRVAILGCGSIGKRHAKNLQSIGGVEILLFEPDAAARETAARELGLPVASTLDEIWNQGPLIAVVASPTNLHVPQAIEAARRGCHLFIEKPLSYRRDDLDLLASEVQKRQLITLVGCNMRFHPGPRKVKDLLEAGAIGDVLSARIECGSYLPDWRPKQDYRASYSASPEWGGAVLDVIHEIDLALWYFGPARVAGSICRRARSLGLETDGLAEILLDHQSGVLSSVHLNFIQRDPSRGCRIIGSGGTLTWDFGATKVEIRRGKADPEVFPQPADWDLNRMYVDEFRYFLECVQRGSETMNSVRAAGAAMEVALTVREGLR